MSKIFSLPTGEISDFVDVLLEKTGQKNYSALDFNVINDFLKLNKEEINFDETIDLPEVGKQIEIRGILDINKKKIYINNSETDHRKRFSNAHELGHYILPKHRGILYQCCEEDMSYYTHLIIEREANKFASELLFKGSLFNHYLKDFTNINFKKVKEISDNYSSSITAALRKIVEKNTKDMAMVVIRKYNSVPKILYTITSESFKIKYFEEVTNLSKLSELYNQCLSSSLDSPVENIYKTKLKSGIESEIKGSFFFNTYETLGILQPV